MIKKIKSFLLEYNNNNKTILMVTHNPKFIEDMSVDKVFLMKNGEIKKEGGKDLIEYVEQNGFGAL